MIDQSKLTIENLDNLNEEELFALEKKYKADNLPHSRLYMLVPYNIVMGGLCMYYTINFRRISKKLFTPRKYGFWDLMKYGKSRRNNLYLFVMIRHYTISSFYYNLYSGNLYGNWIMETHTVC